jgi:hypothetical protein
MPATGGEGIRSKWELSFDELCCVTDACKHLRMMLKSQEEEGDAGQGHSSLVDIVDRALAGLARIGFYQPKETE